MTAPHPNPPPHAGEGVGGGEERSEAISSEPPVIVVHSLAHAVGALKAAARAGQPIVIASAKGAGVYAGPGWFRALVEESREAVPEGRFSALLDCADEAGAALAAIRSGIERVLFTGEEELAQRLSEIARQHGVELVRRRPKPALDLADAFFDAGESLERRVADILASAPPVC
ncbi:MAG TPA: hypothetical protein VGR91_11595 [Stellaceae bacterium]|nr:hypothetical protein [Stellaceae bacterium]